MFAVSLQGVGTVLRLESDVLSKVNELGQATYEYPPSPLPPLCDWPDASRRFAIGACNVCLVS